MNEEEREAYYFFKEQRAMYNKWVADKTASESDVVLARYYNLLFEILDKQQEEINLEKEKNKKLEEDIKVCEIMEKTHKKEIEQLILKLNKSLEVIDLMATFIGDEDIDEMICKYTRCPREDDDCEYFPCKECVKEYYFKKARGNEDDK